MDLVHKALEGVGNDPELAYRIYKLRLSEGWWGSGSWRAWLDGVDEQMWYQGIDTQSAQKLAEGFRLLAEAVDSIFAHSDHRIDSEGKEHYSELWDAREFLRGVGNDRNDS